MPIGDEHQHYYLTWLPIMYHHYRSLLDVDTLLICPEIQIYSYLLSCPQITVGWDILYLYYVYLSKKCQQSTISAFLANKQIHSRIHWPGIYALTSIGYRHFLESGCRRSRDSMVVGFRTKLTMPITTTVVRSSPAHGKLWFGKKFDVTCDRSVVFSGYSGFLHQ